MNIISFGTEQKLFDSESRVYKRIFEYRFFSENYYHFVFTKDSNVCRTQEQNMIVVPVYGVNKIIQILRLASLLRKESIEKTNLVVSAQDPFEIGLLAMVIAKNLKAKLLVQMHSDISTENYKKESLRNRFQARLARVTLTRADRVRVVSSRMKRFLFEELKVPEEKIVLLPIFSVLNSKYSESKNDDKTIIMLCRIEKVKQVPLAIEAVRILREKTSINYKIKIVGDGSQKKKLQEKYNSFSWLVWTPFTENVEKEYEPACCLLISSLYEGFAMTAVESISFGTPVVMTNVGCAGDVILEGVNGSISKDFSAESVAEAIIRTLDYKYTPVELRQSLEALGTEKDYLQKIKQLHTF